MIDRSEPPCDCQLCAPVPPRPPVKDPLLALVGTRQTVVPIEERADAVGKPPLERTRWNARVYEVTPPPAALFTVQNDQEGNLWWVGQLVDYHLAIQARTLKDCVYSLKKAIFTRFLLARREADGSPWSRVARGRSREHLKASYLDAVSIPDKPEVFEAPEYKLAVELSARVV